MVGVNVAAKRAPAGGSSSTTSLCSRTDTARKRAEQLLRLGQRDPLPAEADTEYLHCSGDGCPVRKPCWPFGEYGGLTPPRAALRADWKPCPSGAIFEHRTSTCFAPGVGPRGPRLQTASRWWIADISTDSRMLRKELARDAAAARRILFPVVAAGKTLGVFSFWARTIREPEERMLGQSGWSAVRSCVPAAQDVEEHMQHLATHDA